MDHLDSYLPKSTNTSRNPSSSNNKQYQTQYQPSMSFYYPSQGQYQSTRQLQNYPYEMHWPMEHHTIAPAGRDMKLMQVMKRERLVKFKTELCKNYTNKQVCPFYSSCSFAHGEGERRRNPVSPFSVDYRPEMCKEGTKDLNYCLNNNEFYYHPENYKTLYCKSASTGEMCTRPLCAMAHSTTELKSKPYSNTSLAYLARYQHWDKVKEKLEQNPNDTSLISPQQAYQFTRETALHYAAKYGQVDICRRLILLQSDVNAKDWKDQTPLHKLCAFGGGDAIGTAKLLLENGANKAALDSDGSTPSNFASKANHTHLLSLLAAWNENGGTFTEEVGYDLSRTDLSPNQLPPNYNDYHRSDYSDPQDELEPPLKRFRSEMELKPDPSHQVKIKYDNKLKLVKLPINSNLQSLHQQINQKLNINEPYVITYQDLEGDLISIDDEDDLILFLSPHNPKKLINIELGTKKAPKEKKDEVGSGSEAS